MSLVSSVKARAAYLAAATRKNAALGGFFSHSWLPAALFFLGVILAAAPFVQDASVDLSKSKIEAARATEAKKEASAPAAKGSASSKGSDAQGGPPALKAGIEQAFGSDVVDMVLAGSRILGLLMLMNALLGLKRHMEDPWRHSLASPLAMLMVALAMTFGVNLLQAPESDATPSEPFDPRVSVAMEWIGAAAMLCAAAIKAWIVACGAGSELDREAVLAELQVRASQLEEAEILEASAPASAPVSTRKNSL